MIEIDAKELEKARKELEGIENGIETVAAKAINTVTLAARREMVKEITDKFYIDKEPVQKGIHIRKAYPIKHSFAVIKNNRKRDRFTLGRFRVEDSKQGPIKVAQSRSGGLKELKRGFLYNGQVWRREGKSSTPFSIQRGYSIGGMIERENVIEELENKALDRLDGQLEKEVDKFFKSKEK